MMQGKGSGSVRPGTFTRRKVLKGGAVAGGAVWAVPAVQAIGMGSAHAQLASPPPDTSDPPTDPPPADCKDISNIQIVVSKAGVYYGLKYDPGDSDPWNDWTSGAPDSNDCIKNFEGANPGTAVQGVRSVADAFNSSAVVTIVSDCEWRLALPLPGGYAFEAGYIKSGNVSSGCPTATVSGGSAVFLNV